MNKKVAHLTSVHARSDIRIFLKECSSLSKEKYDVCLIVADGLGDEIKNGVKIYDVGLPKNRFERIIKTTRQIFKKAIDIDADLYHFHDPEMIGVGLKLKNKGKKVIFDSHEDFASDLLTKSYIPIFVRYPASFVFKIYNYFVCKKFDTIVAATPAIAAIYDKIGCETVVINNYPIIEELSISKVEKERIACFVGAQTPIRGVAELVKAIELVENATLYLAGPIVNQEFKFELQSMPGWSKVVDLGIIQRDEVANILAKSSVGLVTYLPAPNHTDSQPNKLFEYMSAGLPVVASNFNLWKEIIEDNYCGVCVNPSDPNDIAKAITYIFNNKEQAGIMGKNGKISVLEKYNWGIEEEKLIKLYKGLLA
ncbi:glycosyltransferase [Campylobacter geochelonis]|uniref:glycosyltransferase n=1 Tax=Campylobacter geochelonis TaxID=1780362 RepID=UPI000770AA30|nr:glycosyltransferase [Campylobacter geochelonis]CZE49290.1 iron compounds ABC transporter ATP-binding protein [Campylobacter geochelonis]